MPTSMVSSWGSGALSCGNVTATTYSFPLPWSQPSGYFSMNTECRRWGEQRRGRKGWPLTAHSLGLFNQKSNVFPVFPFCYKTTKFPPSSVSLRQQLDTQASVPRARKINIWLYYSAARQRSVTTGKLHGRHKEKYVFSMFQTLRNIA